MEKKKNSSVVKNVVCVVIIAALIVGYYFYVSNKDFRSEGKKDEVELLIESVLTRDLEKNYPENPRELLLYYSDAISCVYNEKLTDEQMNTMAVQLRTLFDVELLEQNTLSEYTKNLKADAAAYKQAKKTISNYQVFKNSEVEYKVMDSQNYAILSAYYRVMTNKSNPVTTCEEFLLREDADGCWRIVGWELVNGKSVDE